MTASPPRRIGVLGPNHTDDAGTALGEETGRRIAEAGAILVCGGLGGMMEAAARGAKAAGGQTIGLLPGEDAADANPWIDHPLPTGLGPMRNALIARVCDGVIAIHGGYGTLTEIAFSLRLGKPVVTLESWHLTRPDGSPADLLQAATPEEAVATLLNQLDRDHAS